LTRGRIVHLLLFNVIAALVIAGLVALAVWQTHRRTWKSDLIARVEARVSALPTPAPPRAIWPDVATASHEYLRVTVSGRWLEDQFALVQAATELGGGYWVLTPLMQEDGTIVLINRGFVPADKRAPAHWKVHKEGVDTVTGLLRITEPNGAFLRANDPSGDRWFSRDVEAIATSRRLDEAAPYFIDAESTPSHTGLPVPGLTVVFFSNNHLVYALTWSVLALMTAGGAIFVNMEAFRAPTAPQKTAGDPRRGASSASPPTASLSLTARPGTIQSTASNGETP
jgi:surfeit locus 1 family protein